MDPNEPTRLYTLLRSPREHVISQYFHCKESRDHIKFRDLMPNTFDEWLEYWVEQKRLNSKAVNFRFKDVKFKCTIPVNLQSTLLKFEEMNTSKTSDEVKEELATMFDVIGVQDQMDKSICVILTTYTGQLPEKCNCSKNDHHHPSRRKLRQHQSHYVIHHGATYNTTSKQNELIDELINTDQVLFEHAVDIFAQQVEEVEEEFGITLCDSFTL